MKRALIVAALAVGFAAPAHAADPNVIGTFEFKAGGVSSTWALTPCADDTDHCVHVASTGMAGQQPFSGDAFWSVGSWILQVEQPDAITCNDGSAHPGLMTYSWDAATFTGWAGIYNSGVCDGKPGSIAAPFTLTRTA